MIYSNKEQKKISRNFLNVVITISVVILSYFLIVQTWMGNPNNLSIGIGDVAQQDLRAPRNIEYISNVLTDEARSEAERSIDPVYGAPDSQIARGQLEGFQDVLGFINETRESEILSAEEKQIALQGIENYQFNQESLYTIFSLSDERWNLVREESSYVLEEVMRNPIRTDTLDNTLNEIESKVSLVLHDTEVNLVVELVSPMVVVNSFYSPELTETARLLARNAVEPILVSYVEGEMIVSSGEVITPTAFEALVEQDLIAPVDFRDEYLGAAGIVALGLLIVMLSYFRKRLEFVVDYRSLLLVAFSFLVFLAVARFSIPDRTIVPYLFPIPAFGLLVSTLFGLESGIVFSLVLSVFAAYGLPNALDLILYYFLSSFSAILALGNGRRISHFLWAAGVIAGVGFTVLVAFRFPFYPADLMGGATLAGAAIINAIASTSLALLMQFLLAQFLGLTTALQLLEISRPDFPLLMEFLLKAPGTYQHSLQVANLAEQAAERIGADVLLTRVGALYHDVGKSANPSFFIENQMPGDINSHDDLDPMVSATTIIAHVTDGLILAKKYRLPRKVHDFISEHHGTLIPRYQYNRAVEMAGGNKAEVDDKLFRYPGPKPQSKETAILMFADGAEAIVRAKQPRTEGELRSIIMEVVEKAQYTGQLVDTPLTQKDISTIIESFITTMQGVFHPRLEYPKNLPGEIIGQKLLEEPSASIPTSKKSSRRKKSK